jgi:hypothetical protein
MVGGRSARDRKKRRINSIRFKIPLNIEPQMTSIQRGCSEGDVLMGK